MLSEHTSAVEESLAAAVTVPAEGGGARLGALLLLAVVAAEVAWGGLLAWFVVRLFV